MFLGLEENGFMPFCTLWRSRKEWSKNEKTDVYWIKLIIYNIYSFSDDEARCICSTIPGNWEGTIELSAINEDVLVKGLGEPDVFEARNESGSIIGVLTSYQGDNMVISMKKT